MQDSAGEPLLSVRGLSVAIGTDEGYLQAVRDVSFDLHHGETLGLVGESGCGKTMAMRSLMRILPSRATLGEGSSIRLANGGGEATEIAALESRSREINRIRGGRIGMIFQEPTAAFSPVHTVGAHLAEVVALHRGAKGREAQEIGIDLLDRVGIPKPAERYGSYPHELSGGQRQRAMIALALAGKPSLLIADEPTTALDVTIQAQILELIRQIQEEDGMALIFITHDVCVVSQVTDRIAVMYLGRIVETGPTEEVIARPLHPYTEGLLAATPAMSFGGGRLRAIAGDIPGPLEVISGCAFHPRCGHCMPEKCGKDLPPVRRAGDGRMYRCFLERP